MLSREGARRAEGLSEWVAASRDGSMSMVHTDERLLEQLAALARGRPQGGGGDGGLDLGLLAPPGRQPC